MDDSECGGAMERPTESRCAALAGIQHLWRDIAALLPEGPDRADRMLAVGRTMFQVGATIAATRLTVRLDAVAEGRAAVKLADVGKAVPEADLAYMRRGAARVGLNRLSVPGRGLTPGDYVPKTGDGVREVEVELDGDDVLRATCLAVAFGIDVELAVSAAIATGAAMLCGLDARIEGPFGEV